MVIFAFERTAVVLPLKGQMETPEKMGGPFGVLNIGVLTIIIIYAILGFFGCWRFAGTELSGSITLDLPQDEW